MKKSDRDGIACIAFTDRGEALAERLASELGGTFSRSGDDLSLTAWTEQAFSSKTALIFVGAAGIAVRAIAPYLKSKAEDPAVLVTDEQGLHVISLLSGHIGGANTLARQIAEITGGEAVITTATDLNDVFAIDLWAVRQGMTIRQPERIKAVSSKLLRGEAIGVMCCNMIKGTPPAHVLLRRENADVVVDCSDLESTALQLIPRILTLGIGCRKGVSKEELETGFGIFCRERRILPEAIRAAASIDLKRGEEGLLRFCREHGWPVSFYSSEELQTAAGSFTTSSFVKTRTGVDNVCERAAVLESGGSLREAKFALNGATFALAERQTCFDWST